MSSLASFIRSRASQFRGLSFCVATLAVSTALFAQADPNAAPGDAAGQNGRGRRGQNGANANGNGGGRGNATPEEMLQRRAAMLREQFDVADDAEWKIISDLITSVTDLRLSALGGGFGGRGGFGGGPGGGNRGGRVGQANPEQDALRQAITDKLPEAEIKSRLAHLREVRKANEEKLSKAQEDLRAVLSVRQEAVAVMNGLLP